MKIWYWKYSSRQI